MFRQTAEKLNGLHKFYKHKDRNVNSASKLWYIEECMEDFSIK